MNQIERQTQTTPCGPDQGPIVIRTARLSDERALQRLAELDSHPPLQGAVLIVEVEGEPRAARSLGTGETIADPFRHTAHLRGLLSARAAQMVPPPKRRSRFVIRSRRLYARAEA